MTEAAAQLAQYDAIVAEHRALLAEKPDNLYPAFADALMGRAALLAEEGRANEALAAAEEGVAHYRHLVELDCATFGTHLASSVNNLSNRLDEADREKDARTAGDEAVALASEAIKAGNNPADAHFVLVSALMNQSGRAWRAGEPLRAIDQMGSAVLAFRDGGEDLHQFLGFMVDALHQNALALAEGDRWEEAIELRRMTAKLFPGDPPAAVVHLLALTLEQASFAKGRDGKHQDALVFIDEAVQHSRNLAAAAPEQYDLLLGQSLSNMASRMHSAGMHDGAMDCAVEAINLFQRIALTDAASTVPPLILTLETFASILKTLGHEEQAQHVIAQRDELLEVVKKVEGLEDGDDHDHGEGCGCGH